MEPGKEHHSPDFFVVKDESGLCALSRWLKDKEYDRYREDMKDKHGKPFIAMRYGSSRRGIVLCVADELLKRAIELVASHKKVTA